MHNMARPASSGTNSPKATRAPRALERRSERPRGKSPGNMPFEGFNWRISNNLENNFLWLLVFITQASGKHVDRVWFNHVVLASDYIGPIQSP